MSLEQHMKWLNGHISLAASGLPTAGDTDALSLAPMRELMALLGNPHEDAPAVHITGTNGKGSTSHLVSLILREHGLRVGSYGSPHVSRINERVQINAEPIGDEELADALADVRLAADQLDDKPSWFELLTAAAYRAFSDAAVDVMVIEVGMLGRFDATNVVDGAVAVVTNISKDHTDGGDGWRHKIASEKAGIVKPGATLVIGEVDEDLQPAFVDEGPGSVLRLGSQVVIDSNRLGVGGRVIDLVTPRATYDTLFVALHGQHQGVNLALAVAATEAFIDGPLNRDLLDLACMSANMPGRLEVLSTDPLILIDGGHNPAGARTAALTFAEDFDPYGRRILVAGMMAEKDPVEMLTALRADEADVLVLCAPNWPRAMKTADLAAAARSMGLDPEIAESPEEAIEYALALSTEGDAILVAGSLYVAGAVRNRLFVDSE